MVSALWSPQEDKILRDLFTQGVTFAAIGKALGRTHRAVQSRTRLLRRKGAWTGAPRCSPERFKRKHRETPVCTTLANETHLSLIRDAHGTGFPFYTFRARAA